MIHIEMPGDRTPEEYEEILKWCMTEFGVDLNAKRWKHAIQGRGTIFFQTCLNMYFRDESDALAFKLRWS